MALLIVDRDLPFTWINGTHCLNSCSISHFVLKAGGNWYSKYAVGLEMAIRHLLCVEMKGVCVCIYTHA